MMYTSQEGELYLGQACALGAAGVLPKQIKPADVFEGALPAPSRAGPPHGRADFIQAGNAGGRGDARRKACPPAGLEAAHDTALRDLFADLRRALMASIDTQSERITSHVRMLIQMRSCLAGKPGRAAGSPRCSVVREHRAPIALAATGLRWRETTLREQLEPSLPSSREPRRRSRRPRLPQAQEKPCR